MVFLLLLALFSSPVTAQNQPSCDSLIFCQGQLLHTVQMARIFNDSKSFVDMKLRYDEATTLKNFEQLVNDTNNNPTKDQVKQFVDDNFEEANEFDTWVPPDYTPTPEILSRIEDPEYKKFAENLVAIWPSLARKVKKEVIDNPQFYTFLPVENGFVIPGGRFKEFYYWDSLWIIEGLLLSDMKDTVRGMLDNFISIVDKYGFVPNGARIYYLNRSQPPLLSLMVAKYLEATKDTEWLQKNIQILDKELTFWLENKLVTVTKDRLNYTLAHYDSESGSPRPESYYEDHTTASVFKDENDKIQLWAELKSGAESGWDFSTRWIVDDNGAFNGNLSALHTRSIIPVDLNSFLCQAFRKLAEMYVEVHNYNRAMFWYEKANIWQIAIEKVFYDEDDGIWYDWENTLNQPRKYFFPSNFAPLWAEAYDSLYADLLGQRAAEYFEDQKVQTLEAGIPASLENSGEQWDYPNAWPPLQSVVITGLDKTGNCKAKKLAKEFATRWLKSNMIGYNETGEMFEKYDAIVPGKYGGGGEYVVQSGFGWTNGVVFEFLNRFFATPAEKS